MRESGLKWPSVPLPLRGGGKKDTDGAAGEMIETMDITVKSLLEPTTLLQYLAFKINSIDLTIQLTLSTFDRLTHILRYTKNGSLLGRQRIRGYLVQLTITHLLGCRYLA